jgi:hypothetical protein
LSWCQATIRGSDQFSFRLEIFFRQLRVYYVAPSLMRGRVCHSLTLESLASAVPLGSESRGPQDHILLSQSLRLHKPGGRSSCIYFPLKHGAQLYPWALVSFLVASYDSQGYGGGILTHLHTDHKVRELQAFIEPQITLSCSQMFVTSPTVGFQKALLETVVCLVSKYSNESLTSLNLKRFWSEI